jgi:YVTN family beta-propeller protein
MLRSRVRAAVTRRRPPRAALALAAPVALAGLLLGPVSPARAAGTLLYVPDPSANMVSVVDTSSDTVTATIPVGSRPYDAAVTPDGSQVFVANQGDGTVSVISTATDAVTATIKVLGGVRSVAIDPAGRYAYVVSPAFWLTKIDIATGTATGRTPVGIQPVSLAVSPDGSTVYVGTLGSSVTAVSTATMTVSKVIPGAGGDSWDMVMSPDGSQLYIADSIGLTAATIAVVSTATDTVTAQIPIGQSGNTFPGIAVSPDGSTLYVSNETLGTVQAISTSTDAVSATITGFNEPTGIAVSPNGSTVWVGSASDDTVSVVDPASDAITGSITGFPGNTWGITDYTSYYDFIGFEAPVYPEPEVNQANAGQAIPIQFSLNGDQGTDIFNSGYPAVQQVSCSTGDPVNSSTLTDADTSGNSGLQYDASTETYTYVWKTDKAWAGTCQQFILGLNDGSTHTATFQFR